MTTNKDLKKLVRQRAARTGQSYAASKRAMVGQPRDKERTVARHEFWFSRATQGYSGKGAKPTGYEHHVLEVTAAGLQVTTQVAFSNYGLQRYRVDSDGIGLRSHYDYGAGEVVIDAHLEGSAWTGQGTAEDETNDFSIPTDAPNDVLPSIAGRFLPLVLPREPGEHAAYVPLPEDGFPAWKPRHLGSWFPVMGVARESLIERLIVVCRGEETYGKGKTATAALRYDHVNADGTVRATTWVDTDGAVAAFERVGSKLVNVGEERALALEPKGQ